MALFRTTCCGLASRTACAAVLWIAFAAGALGQQTQPSLENPPGWKWLLQPIKIIRSQPGPTWEGRAGDGRYVIRDADDIFELDLMTADVSGKRGVTNEYRVVVDAGDGRQVLTPRAQMGSPVTYLFLLSPITAADRAATVGIELLTPAGRRVASADALKRAAAAGIQVLPLPEIGQPLRFRLQTLEGKVVSDGDLRGKVVLIDGWATGCKPCMQKMPKLRELYRELRPRGFEILGINFDEKPEKARETITKHELIWPHVYVPADDRTRDLWYEASSFYSLPRLILVDREGRVQADVDAQELESKLRELFPASKP